MFLKNIEKRNIILICLSISFLVLFGLFLVSNDTSTVRLDNRKKTQIKARTSSSDNVKENKNLEGTKYDNTDSSKIGGDVIYDDSTDSSGSVSNESIISNEDSISDSNPSTTNDNLVQEYIMVSDNQYTAVRSGNSDEETIGENVGNSNQNEDNNVLQSIEEATITLSPSTKKLNIGERFTFNLDVTLEDASTDVVKYQSNNSAVADVNQNGEVIAKKKGTAIITAQLSSGYLSTALVNVIDTNNKITADNKTKSQETKKNKATTVSKQKSQETKKNRATTVSKQKSQETKKNRATTVNKQKGQETNKGKATTITNEKNQTSNKKGITNKNQKKDEMSIPNYYQSDYPDVSLMPGTDRTVASSGCGFTSCSMIVSYLTGKKITPREFVGSWSRKYYVYNAGMSWSLPQAAASHYNLGTVVQTTSMDNVVRALKNKQPVMSTQGPGLFTSRGHLIVLRGITSDGKILVNDPNKNNAVGKGYNNRKFSVQEINASNKMYFIFPKKK